MMRLALVILFTMLTASAQMPEKFTNLQVFPKDIAKKDLMSAMRGFSFSLGVRCEFCHVQSADKKMDFAADAKDEKRTARTMLKMVHAINEQYIGKLEMQSPTQVQCVTCHRGLSDPIAINQLLMKTIEKQDVNAAIAKYKDLREKYYGGAQYDFSETPLNQLAEALMAQDRGKDAAAIMEMNVSFNKPEPNNAGWTVHVLTMSHLAAGDTEKAKADLEKILTNRPDDKWAKEELEKLNQLNKK